MPMRMRGDKQFVKNTHPCFFILLNIYFLLPVLKEWAEQSKAKQGTTFMDNPLIQQMSRCIFNST